MRPIVTDPEAPRRADTPRIVEVERSQGHRHHVVMPEQASWLQRVGLPRVLLALGVVILIGGTGYWLLR